MLDMYLLIRRERQNLVESNIWSYSRALVRNYQCHSVKSYRKESSMGRLVGFIIFLFIVSHLTNGTIDSRRVKKWWDEDNKK